MTVTHHEQAGRVGESFSRENQPDGRGGEERGYRAPRVSHPGGECHHRQHREGVCWAQKMLSLLWDRLC